MFRKRFQSGRSDKYQDMIQSRCRSFGTKKPTNKRKILQKKDPGLIHGFSIFDQSTDQLGLALKNRDFRTGMLAIDLRNPVDIDSGHGATSFGIDF